VRRIAGAADNAAMLSPPAPSKLVPQRVLAGIAAVLFAAFALPIFIAFLRGKFDLLGAIFGSVAGTIAALCGWFATRGHIEKSREHMKTTVLGGFILGGIAFVAGFIGPIILKPSANQGPLLGIFFTGPIGFVVGTAAGWLYSRLRDSGADDSASSSRAA
jgi:hypothetical protein